MSASNVVVPDLVMTFDLPGIPYSEPCFANTKYRHNAPESTLKHPEYSNPEWAHGLVGVVYEVTADDYAHILATEGAGAAYKDVLIDCYPLPTGTEHVPEHPTTPGFKAHTLYAPLYSPGKAPPGKGTRFARPDPGYAQPSERYLDIIRAGAGEHSFPPDYRAYLDSLKPYRVTSQRQRIGQFIFLSIWKPIITALFKLTASLSDDDGKSPKWLMKLAMAIFTSVWISYDHMFYPIFGDGERTQKSQPDEEKGG